MRSLGSRPSYTPAYRPALAQRNTLPHRTSLHLPEPACVQSQSEPWVLTQHPRRLAPVDTAYGHRRRLRDVSQTDVRPSLGSSFGTRENTIVSRRYSLALGHEICYIGRKAWTPSKAGNLPAQASAISTQTFLHRRNAFPRLPVRRLYLLSLYPNALTDLRL